MNFESGLTSVFQALSDAGDFRRLTVPMSIDNIKYLFDKDKNILHYLQSIHSSTRPCLGKGIYLMILQLLHDANISDLNMVFHTVVDFYRNHGITISHERFCEYVSMVVDHYNTYYLDDKYYIHGYRFDAKFHSSDKKNV